MNNPVIICIDDEQVVLHGLKSQLNRGFGNEFIIETAQNGEEALEILMELLADGSDIPVVIADQLMPGMKGHEVLKQVHLLSPKTFNILLTGQVDVTAIGDAVNHANLYRYIAKPWDGTDLVLTVKEAIRSYYQDKKLELQNELLRQYNEELENKVRQRTLELEKEKEKSESLLLNILPSETAMELKEKGQSIPKHYHTASILFSDFVGFTTVASKMNPHELVMQLEECFTAFDEIIDRNNMEKIKTIGDAYMCAGGIPNPNTSNPLDAVNAAREMVEWIQSWNSGKIKTNKPCWDIRVGIHTGELVAGVIGKKKFVYDVWGDAVNVASRMESSSEPGKINISSSTYELVKNSVPCIYRGEIDVRNRGAIGMYFVQ